MAKQMFDEMIAEAIQTQHKEAARRAYWNGVVSIMREDKVGLEEAITRFRNIAVPRLEAFPRDAAAFLAEEFNIDAQWLRRKFEQMRELVALADQAGTTQKES